MEHETGVKGLDLGQQNTTIYHIYHTGKNEACYSIHTISDSNTDLWTSEQATAGQANKDTSTNNELAQRELFRRQTTPSKALSRSKREKCFDNPKYDPRTGTSPYFLHLPTLYGHNPPFTLRRGGNKAAPPACLLHGSFGWRRWKLEFGDILAQDGVVDGRGVVNINYGTREGTDGTLKGYKVRPKRYAGESGKDWHMWYCRQTKEIDETKTPAKPDEILVLEWEAPFSLQTRKYHFSWRGIEFLWKGTTTIQRKNNWWPLVRYNHLKLVALVPIDSEGKQEQDHTELCLARYTSVISKRKAGRLEVYQDTLDSFLSKTIAPGACSGREEEQPPVYDQVFPYARQRLQDIVVSTAMCMIMGEHTKRLLFLEFLLELAQGAGG